MPEPILIAARRPGAATAPAAVAAQPPPGPVTAPGNGAPRGPEAPQRRAARIVSLPRQDADERERERQRMLARVMAAEGRGSISRAVDAYRGAHFEFPQDQEVQLQLLEHFDEEVARGAIEVLTRLVASAPPIRRPILDQRLRRLEEYGDEPVTRSAAAALRRAIRA
jgi:hypothetical protein